MYTADTPSKLRLLHRSQLYIEWLSVHQ